MTVPSVKSLVVILLLEKEILSNALGILAIVLREKLFGMHAYIRNFYLSLGTETLKSSDEPVIRGTSVVNWGNMGIFS